MASPAATIAAHTASFTTETTHATTHTAAHATTHATAHSTTHAAHRTTHTLTCRHLSSLLLHWHSIHAHALVVEEAITSVSSHSGTSASHRTLNLFGHSTGRIEFASLAHVKSASITVIPTAFTIKIEVHVVQRLRITLKVIASWSEVEIIRQIAFLLCLGSDCLHLVVVFLTLTSFLHELINFMI